MFFRATNLCLLAVLSACVAQGPVIPNRPSGGTSQSKSSSASTDARTAVVTPPVPAKTNVPSAEALVKFDDPDFLRNPSLTVDKRCFDFARSEAAMENGLFKMVYVAGDCDSNGKANGMGIVSLTGRTSPFDSSFIEGLQAEGVFANGKFVPGLKYHIYRKVPGETKSIPGVINRSGAYISRASGFSCSEMNPSGNSFYGSDKTVCKEIVYEKRMRILKASSDRAIKIDRGNFLIIEAPVKCQGVYLSEINHSKFGVNTEFDGTCHHVPNDNYGERYSVNGVIRVKMLGDTFEINGVLLRLVNGQSSNVVTANINGLAGVTFVSNDGTQFTPSGNKGYEVFIFPDNLKRWQANQPFKVLTFGESIFIKPMDGKIQYPDGKTYNGRFLNGEPIFN